MIILVITCVTYVAICGDFFTETQTIVIAYTEMEMY